MKEEKFSIYRNGKFEEIILKTPDEVKTNHYEIGYAWVPSLPDALPESEKDFHLESTVIINLTSSRLKEKKFELLDEIVKKVKADGCTKDSLMMYDMWDDNGLRPIGEKK